MAAGPTPPKPDQDLAHSCMAASWEVTMQWQRSLSCQKLGFNKGKCFLFSIVICGEDFRR